MGLDTSHDAFHGAYSAFHRWRQEIAKAAGLPPLELMEGFFDSQPYGALFFGQDVNNETWKSKRESMQASLPIKWSALRKSALHYLLHHSDCDGQIGPKRCAKIADALEALIPNLDDGGGGHIARVGGYAAVTRHFIDGCRRASAEGKPLLFR